MATKRSKGLGRGLEALLGPRVDDSSTAAPESARDPTVLALGRIVPGMYQPRTRMDEGALYELAESIRAQGVMQPILVRRLGEDQAQQRRERYAVGGVDEAQAIAALEPDGPLYEIIAGERRARACRLAGIDDVPVLVREVADEAAAAMALIENIQREDLNPLEEAQGLQRLVNEFAFTHEQAAQAVGRSRSAASNLLRLLQLAEPVQTMLMAGDLDMGHARALLSLDRATQITAAAQIAGKKLSVREAERLARKLAEPQDAAATRQRPEPSGDLRRLEQELSDLLAAAVEVRVRQRAARGGRTGAAGEVAIRFDSLDELDGLIERLRRSA